MNLKKKYIFFILLFLVGGYYFLNQLIIYKSPRQILCYQNNCFKSEIADTPKKREIGLMYRTSLDKDKGMFFIFDQLGYYSFWMKNTLIPLDIIRLDENLKIVHIQNSVKPCTADPCPIYSSKIPAKYVLEINAGTSKKLGIITGEKMKKLPWYYKFRKY